MGKVCARGVGEWPYSAARQPGSDRLRTATVLQVSHSGPLAGLALLPGRSGGESPCGALRYRRSRAASHSLLRCTSSPPTLPPPAALPRLPFPCPSCSDSPRAPPGDPTASASCGQAGRGFPPRSRRPGDSVVDAREGGPLHDQPGGVGPIWGDGYPCGCVVKNEWGRRPQVPSPARFVHVRRGRQATGSGVSSVSSTSASASCRRSRLNRRRSHAPRSSR